MRLKMTTNCQRWMLNAFIMLAVVQWAFSQEPNRQLLRQRALTEIEKVMSEVNGVMGLAAKDLTTGETLLVNATLTFPQGSSIKIPILLEAVKQSAEGKFKLTDQLRVERKDMVAGSGVLKEFGDGTSLLSIGDLCTLMIVLSDNTATNMLIDLVGMNNVNRSLAGLDLKNTKLQRKMMNQEASARGEENLSTPAEAMRLMELLYRNEAATQAVCAKVLAILKKSKDGHLTPLLPADVVVANKPGGIEGVSCEWGVVYLTRTAYAIAVMSNYVVGDNAEDAIARISKIVYDYFWRLSLSTPYGTRVPPELFKN